MSSCPLTCAVLVGCMANTPMPRGEVKAASALPAELAPFDMNRVATLAMPESREGPVRPMDTVFGLLPGSTAERQSV